MSRPTLDELHGCDVQSSISDSPKRKDPKSLMSSDQGESAVKFGWIQGVLVRCLINIWGVMLFLRLTWVVAQSGIILSLLIVSFASLVTVITTISMSAICTNGEVRGGGSYYMISRSLGPEFGGSIGVIFSLANAAAVAMYSIGFSETVVDLMKTSNWLIFESDINNVRLVGCMTVVVLLGVALIGTEWEAKTQVFLLAILVLAMCNFVLGSVIPPNEHQVASGFVGWSFETIGANLFSDYRDGENFFSVFAVFFPAATGILAGANISGDLRDPQKAIPLGTMLGIGITSLSYLAFAFIFGATCEREVLTTNGTVFRIDGQEQGLHYNYRTMMASMSLYGPIINAGVFAASLSSALASLVSAPKVFQALCKDKLFPYIHYFAKGFGKNNEPRRGYILTFLIALAGCSMGDLNSIAPIISNFFLAAYCLINFSCFHASYAKSLGFRPSFKFYNMWCSLTGAILCLLVMFIINWWAALITFIICFGLYIIVLYRKPDVNWGSSTQAATFRSALQLAYRLNQIPDHTKNFRPQILLLTGNTFSRPPLVDFTYPLVKNMGFMICGHVVQVRYTQESRDSLMRQNYDWLHKRKIKAFYSLLDDQTLASGAKVLIQSVGIGKLRPNIVMMGFKNDWQSCEKHEVQDYFTIIHEALDKHMSICIFRLQTGLDHSRYGRMSHMTESSDNEIGSKMTKLDMLSTPNGDKSNLLLPYDSVMSQMNSNESSDESLPPTPIVYNDQNGIKNSDEASQPCIPKNMLSTISQYQKKQKKSTIDVWWLYDDGGLTMLLPFILSTKKLWSGCKLRVFALANKKDDLNREQRNMAALLHKFRIEYSDVTVINDIIRPPSEESKQRFEQIVGKWRSPSSEEMDKDKDGSTGNNSHNTSNDESGLTISDSEYLSLKDKSYRHMRLRELLLQHSMDATLIAMTLPMPRKGTCSAPLYMAWLETLTADMPPFMLIRGNQTSVLTFYS
ncbi:sodium chloride cotransporter 69 isoform X2 [Brevipalpus obovatus]